MSGREQHEKSKDKIKRKIRKNRIKRKEPIKAKHNKIDTGQEVEEKK